MDDQDDRLRETACGRGLMEQRRNAAPRWAYLIDVINNTKIESIVGRIDTINRISRLNQ